MVLQTSAPVQNLYKDRHRHAVPRMCLCFSAGRVQGPSKTRSYSTYFAYFAYSYLSFHHSLLSVNLQLSTNAVNKHKFCMWFQSPPYWDAFLLFQWVLQGQYPSPCVEKRLTFPELSAINQQTVVMVVGGGTWTAGLWDGGPSSSSNKQWKPCERLFSSRICIICTICRKQYVEYAQYASTEICRVCIRICKIICIKYAK